MSAYADFEFYVTEYCGNQIDGDSFPRLSMRASEFIDYVTMNKASKDPDSDKVKRCCCALAEQLATLEAANDTGTIASESVGSHSVSYRSTAEVNASINVRLMQTARRYLASTGMLYRGIPICTAPTL